MNFSLEQDSLSIVSLDRRAHERQLTVCRVGLIHSGDANHYCKIKNISTSGFMALVYQCVTVGETIEIQIKSGQVLRGSVVWARDRHVGVAFQNPIDVQGALSQECLGSGGKISRLPRLEIRSPIRLRQGGRHHPALLCDISPGGVQVEIGVAPPQLGTVSLFLRSLAPILGTVRWIRGGRAGIAFHERVGLEPLAEWVCERRADSSTMA